MSGRLASYVHVHQDDGSVKVYGPNDDVPEADAAKITNPKAWATAPEPSDDSGDSGDGPPPKGGAGSGKEAWQAYAALHEVQHDDEASRDDIVAACEAAGVPTE